MANYDRETFLSFLQRIKEQEICTARDNASFVGTFVKSRKSPEEFITSYEKPNSYNNALTALKHYCDFLGVARPNLKPRPRCPTALIIAPKPAEIIDIVRKVEATDVKTYLALCATVGLRPERLRLVKWSQIDFENGLVTMNEKHGMKIYRPNPMHADAAKLLRELREQSPLDQERVFTFAYKKVAEALKAVPTKWRPNNLRDYFYNQARKHCDHDIVEWLMGHNLPGVRAHYLADEIKTEYEKFETAFRLEIA